MIKVNGLKKSYNQRTVVAIDRLHIGIGETIGLVGNNGAGKTTFFRMLLDLIRPDEGEVLVKDESVAKTTAWKNYTASYLDEGFLIDYLMPEEYFIFIGSLQGLSVAHVNDYLKQYEDFFNNEILNKGKYIRDFSKGNQNKVGIAAALIQKPDLLVLDEPFANLDPSTQIRLKTLIKNLRNVQRLTTIISSHDLTHITDVCDRIILLEKGVIIKDFHTDAHSLATLRDYFTN